MKKQVIRLTESDLHRIVENSVRRIIKEENNDNTNLIAQKYARNVVSILSKCGINAKISNKDLMPINEILRDSWYKDKAVELGYDECIHIDTNSSFICVLTNGTDVVLMTGDNIMIENIFIEICYELDIDMYDLQSFLYGNGAEIYEEGDDSLILFPISTLTSILQYKK